MSDSMPPVDGIDDGDPTTGASVEPTPGTDVDVEVDPTERNGGRPIDDDSDDPLGAGFDEQHEADDADDADDADEADDDREHRKRAAQGGRWGLISGLCEQVGSMIVTVLLARLLSPNDFGVVAGATLLMNLLFMFGNVGFGASLIKRKSIAEPIASTTFWASAGMGVVLTSVLIVLSPVLARVLNQPDITPYIIGLAPLLLINMVSGVAESKLLRDLRFPWVYTSDIVNIVLYAAITVALAFAGFGAWSMVIGRVAGELAATIVRLIGGRWIPKLVFSWQVVREDLAFNGNYLSLQVVNFFCKNIDYWTVTRYLGSTALGLYYVAFVLPNILRQRMTWLATEILFPIMARAVDDRAKLAALYRECVEFLTFYSAPLLIGVALTAKQIIVLAFGDQWLGAIAPLRWLAIAAAVEATANCSITLFLAVGKPQVNRRALLWRLGISAAGLQIAVRVYGTITAVSVAVAVAIMITTLIAHRQALTELGLPMWRLFVWMRPIAIAVVAMVATVLATDNRLAGANTVVQAIAMALVGAATYLGVVFLADRAFTTRMLRMGLRVVKKG